MGKAPEFATKPVGHRIQELLYSMLLLRDCSAQVRGGAHHFVLPIFGQLRGLLTDRSKGITPLLVDLAARLCEPLQLYSFPGVDKDSLSTVASNILMRVGGLPVSYHKVNPHQSLLSLSDFLAVNMLEYNGVLYSRRKTIDLFANMAGGAHFPEKVPTDLLSILTIEVDGVPALHHAIVQVADAIVECGAALLRKLCDFSIHFFLILDIAKGSEGVIFDAVYPNTKMRICIRATRWGQLDVTLVGIDGMFVRVQSERLNDWSQPRRLLVSHRLTDHLTSVITIRVDDDVLADAVASVPIFIHNDFLQFTRYINRSYESVEEGSSFGLLHHLICLGELAPKGFHALSELCADPSFTSEPKAMLFTRGSFGVIPVGSRQMQLTNVTVGDWTSLSIMKEPKERSREE